MIAIEPLERIAHRLGVETAGDDASGLGARHEAGIRQHIEMLNDRRQRYREWRGERAHRNVRLCGKPHHQGAPRRVGKRRESAVEG